jgi:hypothetical protein
MINAREITVVVQGPITGKPGEAFEQRLTARCLQSVREHLPEAEIVLSTWRGSDVGDLSFDVLVESDDPGAGIYGMSDDGRPVYHNANRQITSTRAGLKAATRTYAMKLRSDMLLGGTGFLDYFGKYRARCDAWRVLRERVIASTVYARNPHRRCAYPFHPSDWFHFGLREDVLDIWDIPHSPEPETSRWYDTRPKPPGDDTEYPTQTVARYFIEQWIWTSFLRKHGELRFDHRTDRANNAVGISELTIANNLVLAEPEQLQIEFVKYSVTALDWATLYTHGEWLRLYKRYCDPTLICPPDIPAWQKRAYLKLLPVYEHISSPAESFRWTRKASDAWARRSPTTFKAIRSAYGAILSYFRRNLEGK